jgi:hypothetical protein
MTNDDRPTLDYSSAAPKRRTVWDRALSFGRWLSTPRPLAAYYVIMFVLSIVGVLVAILIRFVVYAISGN